MPIIEVDPRHPDQAALTRAAEVIRRGGVVGYPTETVYGLGADALAPEAVQKVSRLKGREEGKAISVLVSDRDMLDTLVQEIPDPAVRLMEAFWPGPLTLVFNAAPGLPAALLGGGKTIAVRISSNPVATALVIQLGRPLTSSSANRSGKAPARSACEVQRTFGQDLDLVIDGGTSPSDVVSTLVRVSRRGITILREGGVSCEEIRLVVETFVAQKGTSPT